MFRTIRWSVLGARVHSAGKVSRPCSIGARLAACLVILVGGAGSALASDVVTIHYQSDAPGEMWRASAPLDIPRADPDRLEEAFAEGTLPKDNLPTFQVPRMLRHDEFSEKTDVPFILPTEDVREVEYASTIRIAHDGEWLYVFAVVDLPDGKPLDGTYDDYGVWPSYEDDGVVYEDEADSHFNDGVWPRKRGAPPFDNTEFVALAFDDGNARYLASHVVFIDWRGTAIVRNLTAFEDLSYSGRARRWRALEELETDALLDVVNHTHVADGRWRLAARVPLAEVVPERDGSSQETTVELNVARVTGDPRNGVPLRASSMAGTFVSASALPEFRIAEAVDEPRVVGASYGVRDGWRNHPVGPQGSRFAVWAPTDMAETQLEYVVAGDAVEQHDASRTVDLTAGLNFVAWPWRAAVPDGRVRHQFSINGERVLRTSSNTAAAMRLSGLEHRLAAHESLSLHVDVGYQRSDIDPLALRLALIDDGARRWEHTIGGFEERGINIDIDLAPLNVGAGDHVIEVILLDGSEQPIARDQHHFEITPSDGGTNGGEEQGIELVDASLGDSRTPGPIRTGIPFPQGMLADTSMLRVVDDRGEAVPAAWTVAGRWSRDGSIKWAHLDFHHDPNRTYSVRRGEGGTPQPGAGVEVKTDDADVIRIDNGQLRFEVSRYGFGGFSELAIRDRERWIEQGVGQGGMYAVDEGGVRYATANADGRTVIEDHNAQRVQLKFTGRCVAEDGTEALRYVMRMIVHADERRIDVVHTLIFSTSTQMTRFRKIGLELGLEAAENDRVIHAGEQFEADDGSIRVWQASPKRRQVEQGRDQVEVEPDAASIFEIEREDSTTWLAVRDFQNKAPLAFEHGSPRGLTLDLWPDMGAFRPTPAREVTREAFARLPFAHQGPVLDFNTPPVYRQQLGDGNTGRHYAPSGINFGNAIGVGRTHEFTVQFAKHQERDAARDRALSYLHRPHVVATPQWMAESGAVGALPMLAQQAEDDHSVLGRLEKAMDRQFDWEMRKLEPVSAGKWTWGAAHSQHVPHAEQWSPWRSFRNTHHGATKGYWYLFARSADPKYLEFAARATEYIVDVGMPNYADTDWGSKHYFGKTVGAVSDYKGHVPWHSGDRFGYNTYADHLLSWYYLTGHPRASDALEEVHRFYLARRHANAGSDRPGASRMETAAALYAHFRDGRLIPYLHASFEIPKSNQTEVGYIPTRKWFGDWLPRYLDLTGRPEARELLRRWATLDIRKPWFSELAAQLSIHWWDIAAYAYREFKDPELLGLGLRRLEREVLDLALLDTDDEMDGYIWSSNVRWNFLHQKILSFMWALDHAGEAVEPVYAPETFGVTRAPGSPADMVKTTFRLDHDWTTWAILDTDGEGEVPEYFNVTFRGFGSEQEDPRYRILAANGRVLKAGQMPQFEWQWREVNESVRLAVPTGGQSGPYYLQVRGEPEALGPIIPFSDLAREVYPTGDDGMFATSTRGHHDLVFLVPEEGEDIGVSCKAKRSYSFRFETVAGETVARETGYIWGSGLGAGVDVEASALEPLRGSRAVLKPIQEDRHYVFRHGRDIPPFVSLSAEAFFIPETPVPEADRDAEH